jgi:hypothetical protein
MRQEKKGKEPAICMKNVNQSRISLPYKPQGFLFSSSAQIGYVLIIKLLRPR